METGADPAVYHLEGSLLTFVAGDDHHWTDSQPIESTGHKVEGLWGNQRSLVDHHHVKLVQFEVNVTHHL